MPPRGGVKKKHTVSLLTPAYTKAYFQYLMKFATRIFYNDRWNPLRWQVRNPGAAVGLIFALLAFGAGPVRATGTGVAGSAAALEEGRRLLATDRFFDQSSGSAALRGLLEQSRDAFAGVEDPQDRLYWLAEVEYLYGFVEQGDDRLPQAQRRFEVGRDILLESLSHGESSRAYRLLADIYAQLLILNGVLYKMSYGPKVKELAEEALRLDSRNAKARLTLALFYKNAPSIAGGSRAKSLQLLHELENERDLERADRFAVNAWLGIAYSESRRPAEARRYLRRALEVYPGNAWLQGMLAELSS
jgi:tetratricopeptide (TPR) repeat protein